MYDVAGDQRSLSQFSQLSDSSHLSSEGPVLTSSAVSVMLDGLEGLNVTYEMNPREGSPDSTPTNSPRPQIESCTVDSATITPPQGYRQDEQDEPNHLSESETVPPTPNITRTVILFQEGSEPESSHVSIETASLDLAVSGQADNLGVPEANTGQGSQQVGEDPEKHKVEEEIGRKGGSSELISVTEEEKSSECIMISTTRLELRRSPDAKSGGPPQPPVDGTVSQQVASGEIAKQDGNTECDKVDITQLNYTTHVIDASKTDHSPDIGTSPTREVNGVGASGSLLWLRCRGSSRTTEPRSPLHAVGSSSVTSDVLSSSSGVGGESAGETSVDSWSSTTDAAISDLELSIELATTTTRPVTVPTTNEAPTDDLSIEPATTTRPVTVSYNTVFGQRDISAVEKAGVDVEADPPATEDGMAGGSGSDKLECTTQHTPTPPHRNTPISSPSCVPPQQPVSRCVYSRDTANTADDMLSLNIMDTNLVALAPQAATSQINRPSSNGSDKGVKVSSHNNLFLYFRLTL